MKVVGPIRWIAFDAGGTLIHPHPPVESVYHRIGAKYGSRYPAETVRERFQTAYASRLSESADLATDEIREREFWRAVVGDVLDDVHDPVGCFEELRRWYADPSAWRCFEDVTDSLARLKSRGFRLALASNFDERLNTICDGLQALREIEVRVISSEVGWRKPHRRFFDALVRSCGSPAGEILFVGDHPEHDVRGAVSAGLQAVHLDREGESAPGVIHSLRALPPE